MATTASAMSTAALNTTPPEENPEPELAPTGDSGSDGYCDHGPLKAEPEPEHNDGVGDEHFVDGYHGLLKEEPEFGGLDGYHDCDPPKEYPEFVDIDNYPIKEELEPGIGDDDGDDVDLDGCYDCDAPEDKPEFVDVHCHPLKEELEPELGDGSGDAVHVEGFRDHGQPKEEPELATSSDGSDTDSSQDSDYKCSHCGISLSTDEFKVEHKLRCMVYMKRIESESQVTKLYHCGYCGCPFRSKPFKEQHEQKWCPKKPAARKYLYGNEFECDKCGFVTKYKKNLVRHILTHNKNNAEWFTCTQCSYKTVHKRDMIMHMKIHNNTFSICCPICGKSCLRKWYLDNHLLRQHSDKWDEVSKLITNKIYTCNICNKYRTTQKPALEKHVSITHHKGEGRPKYKCPRCPHSTFHKENLKRHAKTHLKEKGNKYAHRTFSTNECAGCKKQFGQKQELDSHIMCIHADDVDLMKTITTEIHCCKLCSFKAFQLTRLKSHVRLKHT